MEKEIIGAKTEHVCFIGPSGVFIVKGFSDFGKCRLMAIFPLVLLEVDEVCACGHHTGICVGGVVVLSSERAVDQRHLSQSASVGLVAL